jgi:hypothetical protein
MSSVKSQKRIFDDAVVSCEIIESLQRAIDRSHHRILNAAREKWEQRFAEPNDARATVHVADTKLKKAPRAGYLSAGKACRKKSNTKFSLRRFAT